MCKEARTVTRVAGGEAPLGKFFTSPGKTCWTKFKTIGHGSKFFDPSQKIPRTPWCPKLVTCLKEACVKTRHCCQKSAFLKPILPLNRADSGGAIAHLKI